MRGGLALVSLFTIALLRRDITPFPSNRTESGTFIAIGGDLEIVSCNNSGLAEPWSTYKKSFYNRAVPRIPTDAEIKASGVKATATKINIDVKTCAYATEIPMDESYNIKVTADGKISINASNLTGAVRALSTLMQLSEPLNGTNDDSLYSIEIQTVTDSAKYTYRQALIDTARHYLPLNTLKRIVRGLSSAKYNILHLHLTDAESFAYAIDEEDSPADKLVAGAYGADYAHNTKSMKELVDYALLYGVLVVPEIDIPGHAYSWKYADPDIVAQPNPSYSNINNYPLNPVESKTYDYLRGAFSSIMRTFLQKYKHGLFHLGGDEIVANAWNRDPKISAYMNKHKISSNELLLDFHDWAMEVFSECAIESAPNTAVRPVFWEEVFDESRPGSHPANSIFVAWNTPSMIPRIAKAGNSVVRLAGWYLDQMHPVGSTSHYSFIDLWQDFYKIDPLGDDGDKVPSAYRDKVLGGGFAVWGEKANAENIDTYIWPRAIAIAENLWSTSIPQPSDRQITTELTNRFNNFVCVLLPTGIQTGPLAPSAPCPGQYKYWNIQE